MSDDERKDLPERRDGAGRWGRLASSLGTRVFLSYVLLLTLSAVASVLFIRQILLVRLEDDISEEMRQEYGEFVSLVGGTNPDTGRPFGSDLPAIFDVFFERNVPNEGEAILGLVGGELYRRKVAHDARYPIHRRAGLIRRWTALTETEQGSVELPDTEIRYLAAPVVLEDEVVGTFVVVSFPRFERHEIEDAVRVILAVLAGVVVVALLVAWGLAGRVLGPLRLLTSAARSISESDLTRRIPLRGRGEIAQLAVTFNDMLDRLERAFAAQRAFVDDAGHELRTPITIVRGHLELLDEDPKERAQTIAIVMDELDRMNRMVNDLLVLAKAEQPDFLDLETVDVEALTREVHAKASALASRRWALETTGRGRVVADRQRLTQALVQFASNAVSHTQEGDLIAIGSMVGDGQARFWVRDTGEGISSEDQRRIFDRFTRGVPGRRIGDGAGLGLAIVQAIAEAHGGTIEVESRPGAGATFTLLLPVDQPARASEAVNR